MLPLDLPRPDFYIASIGRSGSSMLANWLTRPPDQIVLIEPFFFTLANPLMVRVQLDNLGMAPEDEEWNYPDPDWQERFRRLFAPRLSGKRWAFKEVLNAEHARVMRVFAPARVIVTVRDIRDVAASFLEKHRLQGNLHRFDHDWVREYCVRETGQIIDFCRGLESSGTPLKVVRYEDFTSSCMERKALCNFLGWQGGGDASRHLSSLNRSFETRRHGAAISAQRCNWSERMLDPEERILAQRIADECAAYTAFFDYASAKS